MPPSGEENTNSSGDPRQAPGGGPCCRGPTELYCGQNRLAVRTVDHNMRSRGKIQQEAWHSCNKVLHIQLLSTKSLTNFYGGRWQEAQTVNMLSLISSSQTETVHRLGTWVKQRTFVRTLQSCSVCTIWPIYIQIQIHETTFNISCFHMKL